MSEHTSAQISRRGFMGAQAAAAASVMFGANTARAARRKPNVLFLWTDEQRPDTMAAYGNRAIHSPNLNRLCGESVVFKNAYVSQPICTPSRSTVMSGLWPHQSGCTTNNIALDRGVPAVPELVNDDDYATGYFGKWHLGDEVFAQHGFQEWRGIEDGYRKYYREDKDKSIKSSYWHWLRDKGLEPDTSGGDFSRGFAARQPFEHSKPRFLELETRDFLRRHRDEPFLLYVNFLEPHMPFFGPFDDEHRLDEVIVPSNFEDPLEENEPESYRAARARLLEEGWDDLPLKIEADWRRLIANYWGLVHEVDKAVGGILTELESLGLAENTIVVYTSDHGDMMGSHRLITKGYSYEECERVPWIMRVPGMTSRHVEAPVSHIDLVPTLLDAMGLEPKADLPGSSLMPLIAGERDPDPVFVEWHPGGILADVDINPGGSIRKPGAPTGNAFRQIVTPNGWKLTLHTDEHHQLFNLKDDPGETTNVFGEAAYRERVAELTAQIYAWQARVGDSVRVEA